jgi:hypothetical protein
MLGRTEIFRNDGIDYGAEGTRHQLRFTPEFWSLTPNFFGVRLSRDVFYRMQCEPTVAHFAPLVIREVLQKAALLVSPAG